MRPYKATIYIYADSEQDVADFERQFYDFVNTKRTQGVAVTARKMSEALARFKDNYLVTNFLR